MHVLQDFNASDVVFTDVKRPVITFAKLMPMDDSFSSLGYTLFHLQSEVNQASLAGMNFE
jgi:hypothetical protein